MFALFLLPILLLYSQRNRFIMPVLMERQKKLSIFLQMPIPKVSRPWTDVVTRHCILRCLTLVDRPLRLLCGTSWDVANYVGGGPLPLRVLAEFANTECWDDEKKSVQHCLGIFWATIPIPLQISSLLCSLCLTGCQSELWSCQLCNFIEWEWAWPFSNHITRF